MFDIRTKNIFLSDKSIADDFIKSYEYPYEVLPNIKNYILELGNSLGSDYIKQGDNIWIHQSASIYHSVAIEGPCIIDENAELRHNAFIRGNVIIGKNCVVGNSSELKNTILYDNVQVPHYNYVGDSILGYLSHMGAHASASNVKGDKKNVVIKNEEEKVETHLKKVGAFLGDEVEIGCACILNPGTIVLPKTNIYTNVSVRGVMPGNSIVKSMDNIVDKEDEIPVVKQKRMKNKKV